MTGPPDGTSRRLGQPTARDTLRNEGTSSIADRGDDGADPHAIGDLLNVWLAIKRDEVDAIVDDARRKAASIPDMRVLAAIVGEQYILLRALETEVARLRGEVEQLRGQRRRVA
jgi:hypothetical protein